MKKIWIITKREIQGFFDSLIAYMMLSLFLGFSGFFTWLYGNDIFLVGQASLNVFFSISFWSLFFFIPALTMRLLAEEKKAGTIELLLTKPVTDREVIIGKYLATLILISIAILATLPYLITVNSIGNLDFGATVCGYLGLLLMSSSYIGIGIFASSITSNQIVSFLIALFTGIFFHIIFGILANNFSGGLGAFFNVLNMGTHIEGISRGVIDTKDIFYFLSVTVVGLFLAEVSLTKRNLSK